MKSFPRFPGVVLACLLGAPSLPGQVVNPADARRSEDQTPGTEAGKTEDEERPTGPAEGAEEATMERPGESQRLRSWELPPVTVRARVPSGLREEDRVGSYAQPRWTATRRFPTTRVYVRPEGKAEFEFWLRPTINPHGASDIRSLWELEFGLPYRLQLDLYMRTDHSGDRGEMFLGEQVELRYALADWGEIPGNPTLYLEWVGLEQRPDKIEPKLLLGGEIAPRWHWGANLVAELELGGEREYEYQLTGGLSYTVIDERLSVGAEAALVAADLEGDRGDLTSYVLLGPSAQFRPVPAATLNVAPLFGIGGHAPDAQIYVNFGWEF